MKNLKFAVLLATLICGGGKSYAHEIEVPNADGVTIYYNFIKNYTNNQIALEVTFQGSSSSSRAYDGKVVIPESVTYEGNTYSVISISKYAFTGCSGLTEVTIPNGVTSIGDFAFRDCSGLTSVTIPNGVTSISNHAFRDCSSLTEVTIPNSVTSFGEYAFSGCSGLTEVAIPNSVTSIGMSAFEGCSGLTELTIPNSVTTMFGTSFDICSGLEKITVESGNPNYDSREDCNAIINTKSNKLITGCKNTIIPGSVTSIGDTAFRGCSGLTSVTIPGSVTSIDTYAFYDCSSLTTIYSLNTTPPRAGNAFDTYHYRNADVYVPQEALEAYQTAGGWKEFWKLHAIDATAIAKVSAAEQIHSTNGQVTVTGLTDGTTVAVYDLGGQQVGQTVSKGGQAAVSTGLTTGAVAVVKVGERSVKVTMK